MFKIFPFYGISRSFLTSPLRITILKRISRKESILPKTRFKNKTTLFWALKRKLNRSSFRIKLILFSFTYFFSLIVGLFEALRLRDRPLFSNFFNNFPHLLSFKNELLYKPNDVGVLNLKFLFISTVSPSRIGFLELRKNLFFLFFYFKIKYLNSFPAHAYFVLDCFFDTLLEDFSLLDLGYVGNVLLKHFPPFLTDFGDLFSVNFVKREKRKNFRAFKSVVKLSKPIHSILISNRIFFYDDFYSRR